jgi:hypothetical protein
MAYPPFQNPIRVKRSSKNTIDKNTEIDISRETNILSDHCVMGHL